MSGAGLPAPYGGYAVRQQTVTQLLPAVGALVAVRMEDMVINCRVTDAKSAWGQVRLQVEPLAGSGSQWVDISRITARLDSDSTLLEVR